MHGGGRILLRSAVPGEAADLAHIHRAARLAAMPWLPVLHTEAEDLAWMTNVVLAKQQVLVATRDDVMLGLIAMTKGWVEHLYVAPPFWRSGAGSVLLERAKELQPDGFALWTFQRNAMARAFYRKHGLVEIRTTNGQDNEEKEPDVLLAWKPAS